jgi:hypothetical protein
MNALLPLLNQWSFWAIVVLLTAVIVLMVQVSRLSKRLKKEERKWSVLLEGVDGVNVEHLLYQHLAARSEAAAEMDEIRHRLTVLEGKMKTAKRFLGIVRYDAFEGVAGEQSFAMAFYDDEGNGALLTTQVGRADTRVFGKRLTAGKPDRPPTQEEQQALDEAARGRPRPRVSSS